MHTKKMEALFEAADENGNGRLDQVRVISFLPAIQQRLFKPYKNLGNIYIYIHTYIYIYIMVSRMLYIYIYSNIIILKYIIRNFKTLDPLDVNTYSAVP